ncbi:hypothetical protein ACO0KY_15390, partial [Undibacterium sp. Dicai25W]|uniref:hypothetical protein n=1 Tax=Undibacterium sp. Dicai25W TaxID=3413034 RepID=UPI003BF38C49
FQYSNDLCLCKSALTHFCSPLAYKFASRTLVMHGLILREGYSRNSAGMKKSIPCNLLISGELEMVYIKRRCKLSEGGSLR